jgi:tetratricopeptide (TPR) repeat protein
LNDVAYARHAKPGSERTSADLDSSLARAYRNASMPDPTSIDQLVRAACVHHQAGRTAEAIAAYRQAIAMAAAAGGTARGAVGAAHFNLGLLLADGGRLDEAIAAWHGATAAQPRLLEAHRALGRAYRVQGRPAEAIASLRQAARLQPNDAGAQLELASALSANGEHEESISVLRRALELNPSDAKAHLKLGAELSRLKCWDEATEVFRKVVALDPGIPEAWNNLGNALVNTGRANNAIEAFERAVKSKLDFDDAFSNLGGALALVNRWDEAREAYQRAISINPNSPEAWNNLGTALAREGNARGAINAFSRSVALRPEFGEAHSNLAGALADAGRYDESIASSRRAIELSPDNAAAHWNLAMMLLLKGDFAAGWVEGEWRWQVINKPHGLTQPQWKGEALEGRTILLHAEQGRGDTIQFVRYVPMVAARGGRVILRCQRELVRLFSGLPGVHRVIASDDPLPPFDLHCPLMSLPLAFGTERSTIPESRGYLRADESLVKAWSARLSPNASRLRVGLAWAGNPEHQNDRNRSIALATLGPLADVGGVEWYSLQKGPAREQIQAVPQLRLIDQTNELADFADTAALVANLDLVLAVDTAVAHLSAAMGRRTWLLLPFVPDWRWLLDRDDSPWYPTARLLRQPTAGDWASVLRDVAEHLREGV